MANPFDAFDGAGVAPGAAAQGNPFDAFDAPAVAAPPQAERNPFDVFDEGATPPAPESSAIGALTRGVTHNLFPAVVGAGGAIAGTAGGALTAPVTGPVGAIAGNVGGAIAGTAAGEKLQRSILPESTVAEMDAQDAADRAAHPIAAGIGSMIGSVPLMLTGGGIPSAIARSGLKRAGVEATKLAVKEASEKLLPRAAGSAATFAGMSGGEAAAEKVKGLPGSEDVSIAGETAKGAVGGAVMAGTGKVLEKFVPLAKTYLGGIGIRAPTDAMVLATANSLYDTTVRGKPFDPVATITAGGESVPAFMLMNAAMGGRGKMPAAETTKKAPLQLRSGKFDMPALDAMSEADIFTLAQEYGIDTGGKSAAQLKVELMNSPTGQFNQAGGEVASGVYIPPEERSTRLLPPARPVQNAIDVTSQVVAEPSIFDVKGDVRNPAILPLPPSPRAEPSMAGQTLKAEHTPMSPAEARRDPVYSAVRANGATDAQALKFTLDHYKAMFDAQALHGEGVGMEGGIDPADAVRLPERNPPPPPPAGPAKPISRPGTDPVTPTPAASSPVTPPPVKAQGGNSSLSQADIDANRATLEALGLPPTPAPNSKPLTSEPKKPDAPGTPGGAVISKTPLIDAAMKADYASGVDITDEWKVMTPKQRQDAIGNGLHVETDRSGNRVIGNRSQQSRTDALRQAVIDKQKSKLSTPPTPADTTPQNATSLTEAKAGGTISAGAGLTAPTPSPSADKAVMPPSKGGDTSLLTFFVGRLREARQRAKDGGTGLAPKRGAGQSAVGEIIGWQNQGAAYPKGFSGLDIPLIEKHLAGGKLTEKQLARVNKALEFVKSEQQAEIDNMAASELRQARSSTESEIPVEELQDGAFVRKNGEWLKVTEKDGEITLKDGVEIPIRDSVESIKANGVVSPNSPAVDIVKGEYAKQEKATAKDAKREELPPLEVQTPEQVKAEKRAAASKKTLEDLAAKKRTGGMGNLSTAEFPGMESDLPLSERASESKGGSTHATAPESKPAIAAHEAVNRRTLPELVLPKDEHGNPATHVIAKIDGKWTYPEAVSDLKAGTQSPWEGTKPTELKALRKGNPIKGEVKVKEGTKYRTEGEIDAAAPEREPWPSLFKEAPAPLRRDAEKTVRKILGANYSIEQVHELIADGLHRLGSLYKNLITITAKGDQNFTLGHEISHAWERVLTAKELAKVREIEPNEEVRADNFAKYFVKNGEGFIGQMQRYFDRAMFRMKQLFGKANGADELKAMHARLIDGVYAGREAKGAEGAEPAYRTAPLEDLRDTVKSTPRGGLSLPGSRANPYDFGKRLSDAKDTLLSTVDGLKAAGQVAREAFIGLPKVTDWRKAIGQWSYQLQVASMTSHRFAKDIRRAIPDARTSEAITNYIDAGGDMAVLARSEREAPDRYKRGYADAQRLTDKQKAFADEVRKYYDEMGETAVREGWISDVLENYINRAFEKDTPWKKGVMAEIGAGNIAAGKAGFLKTRLHQYNVDAEKAGVRTVKDVRQQLLAYDWAFAKTMADRAFVKSAMNMTMPDGRPRFEIAGRGEIVGDDRTTGEANIITPHANSYEVDIKRKMEQIKAANPGMSVADVRAEAARQSKEGRPMYIPFDHPAFRKWKFVTNDTDGRPIIMQGDILVHPDAIKEVKAFLGKSAVSQNPILNKAMRVSSTIKQTMLDLSGFHFVQIGVHGLEHRVNPFGLLKKQIDLSDPNSTQSKLVKGGLMVADTHGHQQFSEGLSGGSGSLFRHVPVAGEYLQAWNDTLFKEFIPRMKMTMAEHALERNRKVYEKDIAAGRMTEDQLYMLTASQSNAAFGHLNYEMLGRSKTTQDLLRLTLLAPDFLEARGRFAAQALTKGGEMSLATWGPIKNNEQRAALLLGAGVLYVAARILNKTINDEYHLEPENAFSLVINGRAYSLRTVQGDIIHMFTEPSKFAFNRLNPVYGRTSIEFLTGRDAFGRKRDPLQQLGDLAKTATPISLRSQPEQRLAESLLNAFGMTNKRYSAVKDVYKMAEEYRKEHSIAATPEVIYDPDNDPLHMLKVALSLDDTSMAVDAYQKILADKTKTPLQVAKYFREYPNRAFTGSRMNDMKFRAGLNEEDKKIYNDAVQERRNISRNFFKAVALASKPS